MPEIEEYEPHWHDIIALPEEVTNGIWLAKKGSDVDATYQHGGWSYRLVYDLRKPSPKAFKSLGWTHWRAHEATPA